MLLKNLSKMLVLLSQATGDNNHALGVEHSLQENNNSVVVYTCNITDRFSIERENVGICVGSGGQSNYLEGDFLVLTAGQSTYDTVKSIKKQYKKAYAYFGAHQPHEALIKDAQSSDAVMPDIIGLPFFTVNKELECNLSNKGVKLIKTIGVPHNLQISQLKEAYTQGSDIGIIPKADKYCLLVLGGDAPTPDGRIKYYTSEEAVNQINYVALRAQRNDQFLLVANAFRTGVYNQTTGKRIPNSHAPEATRDTVSEAVVARLEALKKEKKLEFCFYDNRFGDKINYTHAAMGAILQTKSSKAYIPGESTTFISEAIDTLGARKLIIAYNKAMNENHEKHVEEMYKRGVSVLKEKEELANPQSLVESPRDADVVAGNIQRSFSQIFF